VRTARRAIPALLGWAAAAIFVATSAPARAQNEPCSDCHDVAHEESIHADFDCTDCHSGVDDFPHDESAAAELAQDGLCFDCHDAEPAFADSVHGDFSCLDCHGDAHRITAPSEDACGDCHDAGDDLAASAHADGAGCQDCHGAAHTLIAVDDLESPMSTLGQLQTCAGCHDSPPELVESYLSSVHSRALLNAGLLAAPACSDFHGGHTILPAEATASTVSRAHVPETCGACHSLLLAQWTSESAHGAAWVAGSEDGPTCVDCHSSHEIVRATAAGRRLDLPEDCGGCHGDAYSTYRDGFHGKASDLGFATVANCSDCHTPHANLPADDPRSSVHPDNLVTTCGQCHDAVTPAFASFDPHADPSDPRRHRGLYRVWLFMTALLIAVFGSFGIHDALWLQRSLVALVRGEVPAKSHDGGPWVRRFTSRQVVLHAVVIVSFLLLAATGLPLKFHDSSWAQVLSRAFGGVGATSWLHRLAALVTFGYFLFHFADLVRRRFVDGERGLLWGWKSMLPRKKDFQDLWANLRYFLYRGQRPALDRWSYWEKFDYFAVFWGVVIIGGSGLLLWFPTFFTRFLPGWALNAAAVVHSDEALLAVGFIFVFHFFHTHLRPQAFPLDPVIFLGAMPLARFEEERPEEYRRMVEEGTLDQHLVPAPTRRQLRRASFWGYLALAIGVLLIVGILSALL